MREASEQTRVCQTCGSRYQGRNPGVFQAPYQALLVVLVTLLMWAVLIFTVVGAISAFS